MKIILLAAGEGKRLRPLTEYIPKCMVSFNGKPVISYILDVAARNLSEVAIVTGYNGKKLKEYVKEIMPYTPVVFYDNINFDKTNMVYTLFCAEEFLYGDVIISYSDIIYKKEVLDKLKQAKGDVCVVVDKCWQKLWKRRMDNPLDDAETLKFDEDGYIKELGKKPKSYSDIEGQYIGLIKISKDVIRRVVDFYYSLDKETEYDGKSFDNMYMTSFIQKLIDCGFKVTPVEINGGWLEIDTVKDIEVLKDYEL